MSLDPNMFSKPREREEAALRRAPTPEVVEALVAFWSRCLASGDVDHEELMHGGLAVARAGHRGIDAELLAWMDAGSAEEKVELAAWFAAGYWRAAGTAARPLHARLMGVADRLDERSMTYLGVLAALFSAARFAGDLPPDERALLVELLLTHLDRLERTGHQPGLAFQLRELRHRHEAPP